MTRFSAFLPVACVAALVAAAPALAHPKMVSSTPADGSTAKGVKAITLQFSETLVPQFSGFELVMTGMPGMANHAPMKIQGFKVDVADKSMTTSLPRALPAGSYELNWHAVAADTHRIQGTVRFTAE